MSDSWYPSFVQQYGAQCPICRSALQPHSTTCPNCHNTCKLGLKVIESYLIAWGITATALSLQAGLGLFLLFLILRRPHFQGVELLIFVGISILGIAAGLALIFLIIFRRPFCALPRWAQWLTAVLSLLLIAGSTLTFAVIVR